MTENRTTVPNRRDFLRGLSKAAGFAAASCCLPPLATGCAEAVHAGKSKEAHPAPTPAGQTSLLLPTFLGNDQRRFYGRGTPAKLGLQNKFYLGYGQTRIGRQVQLWGGAGWTGQPTLVRDRGRDYLIIGAFDHHLRKIDLADNREVWRYKFDDVIKGSATVFIDDNAPEENRIVVVQGSRAGVFHGLGSKIVPSFRAISFRTGRELWRLNVRRTPSYSRDNDSSAIYLGHGLLFNAAENGVGYFINTSVRAASVREGILQPEIVAEVELFDRKDYWAHGGNLVAEASPSRLGGTVFLAAGSGHVYGIDTSRKKIVWDFKTGSDMNGTTSISKDGFVFAALERQYIPGQGGLMKLDPSKSPEESVVWFLPTRNTRYAEWRGGIIGSAALSDEYLGAELPPLFAAVGIDGYLYIGSQQETSGAVTPGPHGRHNYPVPRIIHRQQVGPSIATPVFTDGHKLVVPTYYGVYLFKIHFETAVNESDPAVLTAKGGKYKVTVEQQDHFLGGYSFEATPAIWNDKVLICCRDCYLYTLG